MIEGINQKQLLSEVNNLKDWKEFSEANYKLCNKAIKIAFKKESSEKA